MPHMMQMMDGACRPSHRALLSTYYVPDIEQLPDGPGGACPGEFTAAAPQWLQGSWPPFHFVIARLCLNPTLKAAFEYLAS